MFLGNNAAGRIQSGVSVRDGRGSINRVSCSRFSSDYGGGSDNVLYDTIRRRDGMGEKNPEAVSIDVMKPVSRKAPYRGRRGTNLFAPRRLRKCNPRGNHPAIFPPIVLSVFRCVSLFVDGRNARLRKIFILLPLQSPCILFLSLSKAPLLITPE